MGHITLYFAFSTNVYNVLYNNTVLCLYEIINCRTITDLLFRQTTDLKVEFAWKYCQNNLETICSTLRRSQILDYKAGVIKCWGPHEIGDPGSPILWDPLWMCTGFPCGYSTSVKTTQLLSKGLSGHSELTAYKQDGLHQFAHSSVSFRWLLCRLAALPMSTLAATMN